jgi:hypothetical protein
MHGLPEDAVAWAYRILLDCDIQGGEADLVPS